MRTCHEAAAASGADPHRTLEQQYATLWEEPRQRSGG